MLLLRLSAWPYSKKKHMPAVSISSSVKPRPWAARLPRRTSTLCLLLLGLFSRCKEGRIARATVGSKAFMMRPVPEELVSSALKLEASRQASESLHLRLSGGTMMVRSGAKFGTPAIFVSLRNGQDGSDISVRKLSFRRRRASGARRQPRGAHRYARSRSADDNSQPRW